MASDRIRRDTDAKIVILDSSAIMMLFEFSIDLQGELTRLLGKYHVVIPIPIVRELEFLSKHGKGKKSLFAKPSLKLIEKYDVEEADGKGDDAVFCLAKKLNCIVVTNDRELKNRLKTASLQVIYLRGKGQLSMD
jgi:rRNA-processing protein FCF1